MIRRRMILGCMALLSLSAVEGSSADVTPVVTLRNVTLSGTTPYVFPDSVLTKLKSLTNCTFALEGTFDATQPTATANCIFGSSDSTKTNAYFTFSIYKNGGRSAFGTHYTKDDGAEGFFSTYQTIAGASHRMALSMDVTNSTYVSYLDGAVSKTTALTGTVWPLRTLGNVPGVNVASLGGIMTKGGTVMYPAKGTINTLYIYPRVLTVAEVAAISYVDSTSYKLSAAGDTTWYYIKSNSSSTYCRGKVVTSSTADGTSMTFGPKATNANQIWCFLKGTGDKVAIYNMGTKRYMAADPKNGTVTTPQYTYTVAWYTGTATTVKGFTIQGAASNPMHAQNAGSTIVDWQVEAANPSSLWVLDEVPSDVLSAPRSITSTNVEQGTVMTAIGAKNVPLLRSTLEAGGFTGTVRLTGVSGKIVNTTDKRNILKLKAYMAPDAFELNPSTATLLGETTPQSDSMFTISFANLQTLSNGSHYLWVTADLADNTQEGSSVDLAITSYETGNGSVVEKNGNPAHAATVFLTCSAVFNPGDYASRYYRIPAVATAKDGSIVTVCDRRWGSSGDLPNNIDVVVRRSTDNGQTWSEPVTIAGTNELGGDYGHGDPAIVLDRTTGKLIVFVTSKRGFFYGTPTDPCLTKIITSSDNGITWTAPKDVTSSIYGSNCTDAVRCNWYGIFPTSGAALQTRDGSLYSAIVVRTTASGGVSNYVMKSDDHGATWYATNGCAATGADEAKLIERNNGDLLISVRHGGGRIMNTSSDKGVTWGTQYTNNQVWGPACNGDMINYTSTLDGFDKNRLLHSIPWSSTRENVSVLISYDEGKTWTHRKSICPRSSAYSALHILPDGTIGCYVEDDALVGGYVMRYVRFSLSWLTDGEDTYTKAVTTGVQRIGTEKKSPLYDLSGKTVSSNNLTRGIYVQNNRKFIINK